MSMVVVAMTVLVFGTCLVGLPVGLVEMGRGIFTVAWSPDGTQIAYEADNGVWVVPSDGSGAPRRVHPYGETPLWAPNGRSLAFATWDYGCSASTLWVVDVDWAETRHLADCVRGYDWSPTSQSLVITDVLSVNVYVVDATSGTKRLLFSTTDDFRGPAWSPDARSIIFAGTPVGHAVDGLWAAPVDGGQLRLIAGADSGYFIDDFLISPSGRQMALLEIRDQPEAHEEAWLIVDSDGSDRTRVEYSDRPQWIVKARAGPPVDVWWSPDGTRVAGVAGSGTASELWVQREDGGQRVVIAER